MTIFETLDSIGLPWAYGRFKERVAPPFIMVMGSGQVNFKADDKYYQSKNSYRVEYYFTDKDEETESAIEKAFLDNGFYYQKSEDIFIESEGVFAIYYYV